MGIVLNPDKSSYEQLKQFGLIDDNKEIKLHLGCGETYLYGYVNIDFPPIIHPVMTEFKADVFSDINNLKFPKESLDEIRLHHVFEHFDRVEALGLIIIWSLWLKPGGTIYIETPDFENSARIILDKRVSMHTRLAHLRNLTGGQAAPWAYHKDLWFSERFKYVFEKFGYEVSIHNEQWKEYPFLEDVHCKAIKKNCLSIDEMFKEATILLEDFTINENFRRAFYVWQAKLYERVYNYGKSSY